MFYKLITVIATLATLYNDWRAKQAALSERKKIEREVENEADRIAKIVADIRNDPNLNDELLLAPKDRDKQ